MGMNLGSKRGGVQRDINVTPLIDVLLVLLIIFLVVMPIMMKVETVEVPQQLPPEMLPDPLASQLTIKVKADLSVVFNDGNRDEPIEAADMVRTLRPKLAALSAMSEKVVFVDYDDPVPWSQVVSTMDTIRSLAADSNHDAIKIALRIKDPPKP
jgi:biopolymer transport protein TolR